MTEMHEAADVIAEAVKDLARAVTPMSAIAGEDAAGGRVSSLTEAVMGITAGLVRIAEAIDDHADAVRTQRRREDTDFSKIDHITSKGTLLEAYARALLAAGKKIKAIETFDQLLQLNLPATWKDRINQELDQMAEAF